MIPTLYVASCFLRCKRNTFGLKIFKASIYFICNHKFGKYALLIIFKGSILFYAFRQKSFLKYHTLLVCYFGQGRDVDEVVLWWCTMHNKIPKITPYITYMAHLHNNNIARTWENSSKIFNIQSTILDETKLCFNVQNICKTWSRGLIFKTS